MSFSFSRFRKRSPERGARWHWPWVLLILGAVAALVTLAAWIIEHGWWREAVRLLQEVDPVLAITLMAILPLFGFSIGVVYVVAGMRFGMIGGGLVIAAVTSVHLLGSYLLTRGFLRAPLQRLLARRNHRIPVVPPGAESGVAAIVALVPGAPYFLRNYGLALTGMPLRKYFAVCLLIYTARSYVTLALGDLGSDPSREGLLWLGGIFVMKVALCAWLIRRIRLKMRTTADAVPADVSTF